MLPSVCHWIGTVIYLRAIFINAGEELLKHFITLKSMAAFLQTLECLRLSFDVTSGLMTILYKTPSRLERRDLQRLPTLHPWYPNRKERTLSITSARSLKQQQDVYMQLLMQQENNFKGFVQILVVSTNKRDLQGVDYKVQRQMHRHQYHVWISLINDWWESRLPQASIQTE